jgi:hypothetical protein
MVLTIVVNAMHNLKLPEVYRGFYLRNRSRKANKKTGILLRQNLSKIGLGMLLAGRLYICSYRQIDCI